MFIQFVRDCWHYLVVLALSIVVAALWAAYGQEIYGGFTSVLVCLFAGVCGLFAIWRIWRDWHDFDLDMLLEPYRGQKLCLAISLDCRRVIETGNTLEDLTKKLRPAGLKGGDYILAYSPPAMDEPPAIPYFPQADEGENAPPKT